MGKNSINKTFAALLIGMGLVGVPTLSQSAPVSFYAWAPTACQTSGNPLSVAQVTTSSSSISCAGDTWTADASASADLANGVLKSKASIVQTSPSSNWPGGLRSTGQALMGNSFYTFTTGGQPFTWGPNDSATFSFAVDGSISVDNLTNNSFLGLLILAPGGLDVFAARQNGTSSDPLTPYVISSFRWDLLEALSYPIDLTATFFPGGDFEWSLTLTSLVNSANNVTGFADVNFFDTVNVSYTGPEDTLTKSAAAFPGTVPVPEPSTFVLFGFGILGVGALRQMRRQTERLR